MRISDWSSDVCSSDLAESSTLPKRTVMNRVVSESAVAWQIISARRLLAPRTLAGSTALSVEISTNVPTPACRLCSTTVSVARTLRAEEHTSELQSLMRNTYAVFL